MPKPLQVNARKLSFSNLALSWLLWLDDRIQTSGFRKSLRSMMVASKEGLDPEFDEIISQYRVIPDAFLIDDPSRVVYMFEIEDTHEIPIEKLHKLERLWFYLDCMDWELRLFLFDRYLQNWRVLPIPDTYFALVDREFNPNARPKWGSMKAIDWDATYEQVAKSSLWRPVLKDPNAVEEASSNPGLNRTRRQRAPGIPVEKKRPGLRSGSTRRAG